MNELVLLQTEVERSSGASMPLPGLGVYTSRGVTPEVVSVVEPTLLLVVQGAKRAVVAGRPLRFSAGQFLVVTVDLPMTARVVLATDDRPYLAIGLALRLDLLSELLAGEGPSAGVPPLLAEVVHAEPELLDAFRRLFAMRARPQEVAALASGVEREIYWRLLQGATGAALRARLSDTGRIRDVAAAIGWIRGHLYELLRVDDVAVAARMSPATLRRHFRAVTATTPLGYQKLLRLHDARRRLRGGNLGVSAVAASVGFSHRSQFTREYRRMFGVSPVEEIRAVS